MSPRLPASAGRWTVLAVVCAAISVVVIDVTVLHVAAPAMTEDLKPSAISLLWIIDVYPLVVAPLLVASGALGDRFGRKRMLLVGLVIFGVASALATAAWSPLVLIAARAVMGVGGALILPASMAIVRDAFEDRNERRTAVGIWSATMAGGAAIGPLVGGFLVEHWWWGAVFLINVPVVLIVLPLGLKLLPESRAQVPPPWDTLAVVLAGVGILGLAWGLKEGARHGFTQPLTLVVLVAALSALTVFARRQLARAEPLLDVRLFADRAFTVATGVVLLSMFGLVGLELFFAQYLQLVLGLEPLAASVRLLPLMLSSLVGGLTAARLLGRLGTRTTVAGGLLLTTIALVPLLALGVEDQYLLLALPFLALGFGLEVALVAANDVIISAVPAERAGNAAAIEETAYELGGGLGVAVLGSILAAVYSDRLQPVPGVSDGAMAASGESLGRAVEVASGLPRTVGDALVGDASQAFLSGLHAVVIVSVAMLAVSAVLAAIVLRRTTYEAAGDEAVEAPADTPAAPQPRVAAR
ncbi:MFS transporter [Conexibacter sp. JD483]|uniref:MFS transporter n=1 Tax=unclassified Conexibacter TaxID=2627773 RepID=UPI002723E0E4|nr:MULTISPECIES: MFS transporter [unclassified Conexibacter]MDO8186353.1 MFS transporter [Conexibacter sp. CPCC 205706]MDO8199752.1 MFS transporter [Conexibacter sp. CPCC 205762]MDR9372960.1 MFS transporter [Conexibacter sp. JD483]